MAGYTTRRKLASLIRESNLWNTGGKQRSILLLWLFEARMASNVGCHMTIKDHDFNSDYWGANWSKVRKNWYAFLMRCRCLFCAFGLKDTFFIKKKRLFSQLIHIKFRRDFGRNNPPWSREYVQTPTLLFVTTHMSNKLKYNRNTKTILKAWIEQFYSVEICHG